jgi:hypothetical protein
VSNVLQPRELQEMFLQCVEAFLKNKNKPKREFDTISNDKKAAALSYFLSNKQVLQSLYDLMFF